MAAKTPCAKHRDAQARYVRKDPDAQRARARRHYKRNAAAIKAQKKAQRKSGAKPSGKRGRPRTGCKS